MKVARFHCVQCEVNHQQEPRVHLKWPCAHCGVWVNGTCLMPISDEYHVHQGDVTLCPECQMGAPCNLCRWEALLRK